MKYKQFLVCGQCGQPIPYPCKQCDACWEAYRVQRDAEREAKATMVLFDDWEWPEGIGLYCPQNETYYANYDELSEDLEEQNGQQEIPSMVYAWICVQQKAPKFDLRRLVTDALEDFCDESSEHLTEATERELDRVSALVKNDLEHVFCWKNTFETIVIFPVSIPEQQNGVVALTTTQGLLCAATSSTKQPFLGDAVVKALPDLQFREYAQMLVPHIVAGPFKPTPPYQR